MANRSDFFATCPKCRCTFGTRADVVFKYIERLAGEIERVSVNRQQKIRERHQETPEDLVVA